jgi:hypothetical protein
MSLKLPPPLNIQTVLGAYDTAARATARDAGDIGLAAVRRIMPARTGRARRGQRRMVRRTALGYIIEVSPTSRVRYPNGVSAKEVTRWVDRGTGIHGPRHQPIRPRKGNVFRLPGGFVADELPGQKPQHVYARAHTQSDILVQRELERGAHAATQAAARVLARSLGR